MSAPHAQASGAHLDAMVPRYERRTYEPDDSTIYDIFYVDRTTGLIVMSFDGADPANTNPAYGAKSDRDCFADRGLDIDDEVPLSRCVVAVPPGEAARWERTKTRRAECEREETEAIDLMSFLGDEATKSFNFTKWQDGEYDILAPALEARGYRVISFYMLEEDSFGPLGRGCVATKDGKRQRFFYG